MISTLRRRLAPVTVLALLAAAPALAQQQPPQQNPACSRLEAQLGTFDRGNNDAARAAQVKQLEDQINRQQFELDKKNAELRRANCEGGFFLFGGQGPQCGPLNAQVQQQRSAIDRSQQELQRLQVSSGPSPERDAQRRALLVALSQNDCGPQYRNAAAAQPAQPRGGLFETLFGANANVFTPGDAPGATMPGGPYKTICVRMCDGFYYPISYASNPGKFADDTRACQASCPAAEVQLYSHRNPGEDINQATNTMTQQPYTALPTAFKYRQAFDNSCSCKQQGQTWAQALKHIEDQTVETGDMVVTPERAKQLSQPRFDAQGKPIRQEPAPRTNARIDPKTGRPIPPAPTPAVAAAPVPPTPAADDTPDKPDPKRAVRNVGPTFIPAR